MYLNFLLDDSNEQNLESTDNLIQIYEQLSSEKKNSIELCNEISQVLEEIKEKAILNAFNTLENVELTTSNDQDNSISLTEKNTEQESNKNLKSFGSDFSSEKTNLVESDSSKLKSI